MVREGLTILKKGIAAMEAVGYMLSRIKRSPHFWNRLSFEIAFN
jgi:hypothetical protein